ncbi:haloacid dehalogenase [bacterium SM23_57]|jgi:translin|nr:MAG: haloacid dehalogenase [bacterium SM23_57]
MDKLEEIIEQIHRSFEIRTRARDQALKQARILTRFSANAIRAVHRNEHELAQEHLSKAQSLVDALNQDLNDHPDIYFAGYTQDAMKEFAEASITYALINHQSLPMPDVIKVEYNTYLKGLAESAGELRRKCLDILRHGHSEEAESLLNHMDDIYAVLVTMDYPDAITGGLRRLTDIVRGITERTRGDLTLSLRQERLEKRLQAFEKQILEENERKQE